MNKVWIAEFDGICSVDQYVLKVKPGNNRRYIAHYLRSRKFLNTAPINSAPGQLPRIRSGEIGSTSILLPPLREQQQIAAILDRADQIYKQRRHAIDLLAGLTQCIFSEIFGDPANNFRNLQEGIVGDLVEDTQYGTSAKAYDVGDLPVLERFPPTPDRNRRQRSSLRTRLG
ncbi:restriction endonuclease subunit S [Methylobacterium sp. Leaf113]|uniref:restriction endonuclease subunit S n=1 Tax=Methylobacterium sp. Leaf113 TaxID=1736259 RepID=UPI0009E68FF6